MDAEDVEREAKERTVPPCSSPYALRGRMRVVRILLWSGLLSLVAACAGSGPRVRDVTELAPPVNVRLADGSSSPCNIVWQASPDEKRPDFAGYNIYISYNSLILAPVKNLPQPVLAGKIHEYLYSADVGEGAKFVHVRSRNAKGDISLPSLPEIEIRGN